MKIKLLTLLLSLAIVGAASAANKISLAQFYQQYSQLDAVQNVETSGVLNGEVAMFLMNKQIPIDQKAAVVNTFTNNNELGNTAETYSQFIAREHRMDYTKLDMDQLSGEELFILGYFTMIDDKGDPSNALPILRRAEVKLANSQTVKLVLALAEAQQFIDSGNTCDAWQTINQATSGDLNNDLDQGAVNSILAESSELKSACD